MDRFRELRTKFREADKRGAVRLVDEGLFSQYENRKFSKSTPDETKEIVFMVGSPCSGKSTYIKENLPNHWVLSRDEAILGFYTSIFGKEETYNVAYRTIHNDQSLLNEFDRYFENIIKQLRSYSDIVVDMTMMSLSSRRKMMNNFPKHTRKAVVMLTDEKSLFERNDKRFELENKNIPDYVFLNMAKSFVYPVEDEGFTEIKLVIN